MQDDVIIMKNSPYICFEQNENQAIILYNNKKRKIYKLPNNQWSFTPDINQIMRDIVSVQPMTIEQEKFLEIFYNSD